MHDSTPDEVVEALRAHAPMWLLQMPGLVSDSERESLQRQTHGATRERMLREMGDALEALARARLSPMAYHYVAGGSGDGTAMLGSFFSSST